MDEDPWTTLHIRRSAKAALDSATVGKETYTETILALVAEHMERAGRWVETGAPSPTEGYRAAQGKEPRPATPKDAPRDEGIVKAELRGEDRA